MMPPLLLVLAGLPNFTGPVQGLTSREDVVALAVVEPSIACGPAKTHVELIDVQNGKTKVALAEWTHALGELADGGIVVTSQTRAAGPLTVGVIERGGRKRFSCSVQLPANTGIEWQQSREGLRGLAGAGATTLGIQVTLDANACMVTQKGLGVLTSLSLPGLTLSPRAGLTLTLERSPAYVEQVARRDGKIVWSRRVEETRPPCVSE